MSTIESYETWFEEARQHPAYWAERAMLDFTIALNDQMTAQGVTQAELGRRAGMAPAALSRALSGTHNVTVRTMARLAHALGMQLCIALHSQAQARPEPQFAQHSFSTTIELPHRAGAPIVNTPMPYTPMTSANDSTGYGIRVAA